MFNHYFVEGLKNLIRSFWLSITAIFIITVSLMSVTLASSLWLITGFTLRQLDNQAIIYVYLKDGTSNESKNIMQNDLKINPDIKDVAFIDKTQAEGELKNNPILADKIVNLEKVAKKTNNSDVLSFYKESFKITPIKSEKYDEVVSFVTQDKYTGITEDVQKVDDNTKKNLQQLYYWTTVVGAIFVVVFGLISILVMINILRLAIYSRRDEIEIMRLVGATNSYIRGPFIIEGMYYNLIASSIVVVVFVPSILFFSPYLKEVLKVSASSSASNINPYLFLGLAVINLSGITVGVVSSFFATQRYLKL